MDVFGDAVQQRVSAGPETCDKGREFRCRQHLQGAQVVAVAAVVWQAHVSPGLRARETVAESRAHRASWAAKSLTELLALLAPVVDGL